MAAYNKTFELTVEDLELIETALYRKKADLSQKRLEAVRAEDEAGDLDGQIREIAGLLGRLHNQKIFFRPKSGVYVGG
ncbi:MAG: hypothetical protein MK180_01860 [Rhodobacteraceae bacterium]|nr:hypothetical protein [Paracoccaceae bacterium]